MEVTGAACGSGKEAPVFPDIAAIDESPVRDLHARQVKLAEPGLDAVINLVHGERLRAGPAPWARDVNGE